MALWANIFPHKKIIFQIVFFFCVLEMTTIELKLYIGLMTYAKTLIQQSTCNIEMKYAQV